MKAFCSDLIIDDITARPSLFHKTLPINKSLLQETIVAAFVLNFWHLPVVEHEQAENGKMPDISQYFKD